MRLKRFNEHMSSLEGVTQEDISNIEEVFNDLMDFNEDIMSIEVDKFDTRHNLINCISNPILKIPEFDRIFNGKYNKKRQDILLGDYSKFCDTLRDNLILVTVTSKNKSHINNLDSYFKRASRYGMLLLASRDWEMRGNVYYFQFEFIKNKKEIENICANKKFFTEKK